MRAGAVEGNSKKSKLWVLPVSARAPYTSSRNQAVVGCAGIPESYGESPRPPSTPPTRDLGLPVALWPLSFAPILI